MTTTNTLLKFGPMIGCEIPAGLLKRLEYASSQLRYCRPTHVYYIVEGWGSECCGVFGDGANGSYEWFIWRNQKQLETSDCGYGSQHVALRDALNVFDPPEAK